MKITDKNQPDINALRHSCAHLLAAAVKKLWPGTNNAIGPSIENGFYQDFDFGEHNISETDLPNIEKKMQEILATWGHFEEKEVTVDQARIDFADNPYKLELIEEFAIEGKKITENDPGGFLDLCKGGHSENPQKDLRFFKLLSLAGAYWRGSEKNKMLTRIYGTAFSTKDELDNHLKMLSEAKKRDHKILGVVLDLFTFSPLVGSGLPLWTPKGTLVRNLLDEYVWQLRQKRGYQKVEIPHITKRDLYEKSGHWEKFKDDLFKITTREGHEFAMKPMNCPHHTQIYARKAWSYRELPQRYANTTTCYRDEQSGELSGLSRVRAFAQDDAHVFCRMSQVKEEFVKIWDIVHEFYPTFGFELRVRLSTHDPKTPEKYLGDEKRWADAENLLKDIAIEKKSDFYIGVGEAAFYGPKLDFMAFDSLGREWQVATIQLDMNMPERFDLTVTNEKGESERIVMIHAAIMGSIERFLSILIEHTSGNLPLWLSPTQVVILPLSDRHIERAKLIANSLQSNGIRIELDDSNETLGKKIRLHTLQKTPYLVIIGDKESQSATEKPTISVRKADGEDLGMLDLSDFIITLKDQIETKISR